MYAQSADITDLYGPDALYVADRDGDGVAEADAVDRALVEAAYEIDSYLATRYALPLPPGTQVSVLRQLAVDIAVYRLAQSRDVLTEELRRRYDDATASLRRIADGKQALPPPDPATTTGGGVDGDGVEGGGPRPILQAGPEREFSRAKMRGL